MALTKEWLCEHYGVSEDDIGEAQGVSNSTTDHTTVFQVVADAIRVSVSHNRIETLRGGPYTEAICAALSSECEDSTENGETTEFWGTNIDGDTWRVHVRA